MLLEFRDIQADTHHKVGPEGVVLGRERSKTDIAFRDESISKRHARIHYRDGQWWLEDLNSSNGTYLGGERLTEPAKLLPGTEFALAQRMFEVLEVDPSVDLQLTGGLTDGPVGGVAALPKAVGALVAGSLRQLLMPARTASDVGAGPAWTVSGLAIFGAVAGLVAYGWSPLVEALAGATGEGPDGIAWLFAGAVGLLGGAVAHPLIRAVVSAFGGNSDEISRSRFTLWLGAWLVLASFPLVLLISLPPGAGRIAGLVLALWGVALGVFGLYRWCAAFELPRAAGYVVLGLGAAAMVAGAAMTPRWMGDDGGQDQEPRMAGAPSAEAARSPLDAGVADSSARGFASVASTAAPAPGGPDAGQRRDAEASPREPPPAAKPPTTSEPPAKSAYEAYAKERNWIEDTFDRHPELLEDRGIRRSYERLLSAEQDVASRVRRRGRRRREPWYDDKVEARLVEAERFKKTGKMSHVLAERMRKAVAAASRR